MNVLDCETYKENKNVIIYCISYSLYNNIFSIYKNNDNDIFITFLDSIASKCVDNTVVFFIHNINFDGMLIMESVFKFNLKFNWIIRDLSIYMIEVYYLEIKIIFKCSYKFIPIALKNININNLKKSIFPYNFVNKDTLNYIGECPDRKYFDQSISEDELQNFKSENKIFDLKKKTIEYCENDVKVTANMLEKLLEILVEKNYVNLFSKSVSAPSLSHKIFFKFWNDFNIKKRILKEEDIYIRKSYFGGRCEVFGNPDKDDIIHYFDFSGMYGQCMEQNFPVGDGEFKTCNLNYKNIGFHCIKFKSNLQYPILPIHSNDGKLVFANGVFTGCYWYEEISLFEKFGGEVLEIFSSYEFKEEKKVFKNFVNEFNEIKKKGGMWKIFGKLMINSLYGGFAMSDKNYESIACFSEIEAEKILEKMDVIEYTKKNNCYLFKILKNKKSSIIFNKKEKKWSESLSLRNIVYSSIISSKARIKLYLSITKVIETGGRVFYCDTDSIAAGYKNNNLNVRHGEIVWSEIWDDAVFIAPKFYSYIHKKQEIIKLKGISDKQYSFSDIKNAFYSNKSQLVYKNQLNFNKKNFKLEQNYIDKIIFLNNYNKRVFTDDKKNTSPIWNPPYNE